MPKTATASEPALYCRKCSYDLRGQLEHRCPECGRPYDPADPKTFRCKPRGKAWRWIKRIAAACAVLLFLASLPYAWLYYDWRQEQPAVARMKELDAYYKYKRINLPIVTRLLPKRFGWMLDRVSYVHWPQVCNDSDLVLTARCRQLEGLDMPCASLTDNGVAAIGRLTNLRYLFVADTGVTDAWVGHLARCRQLSSLYLCDTSLTDEGLARLCDLPELTKFAFGSSRVTNAGLRPLVNLPKLDELYIASHVIDDDGLAILGRLSSLQAMDIFADQRTPEGEKRLRQSLPNCKVTLRRHPSVPTSAPSTVPADRPTPSSRSGVD